MSYRDKIHYIADGAIELIGESLRDLMWEFVDENKSLTPEELLEKAREEIVPHLDLVKIDYYDDSFVVEYIGLD